MLCRSQGSELPAKGVDSVAAIDLPTTMVGRRWIHVFWASTKSNNHWLVWTRENMYNIEFKILTARQKERWGADATFGKLYKCADVTSLHLIAHYVTSPITSSHLIYLIPNDHMSWFLTSSYLMSSQLTSSPFKTSCGIWSHLMWSCVTSWSHGISSRLAAFV